MPETIAIRAAHVLESIAEEMRQNPRERNATECAEGLILDGLRFRDQKRSGRKSSTSKPATSTTNT